MPNGRLVVHDQDPTAGLVRRRVFGRFEKGVWGATRSGVRDSHGDPSTSRERRPVTWVPGNRRRALGHDRGCLPTPYRIAEEVYLSSSVPRIGSRQRTGVSVAGSVL